MASFLHLRLGMRASFPFWDVIFQLKRKYLENILYNYEIRQTKAHKREQTLLKTSRLLDRRTRRLHVSMSPCLLASSPRPTLSDQEVKTEAVLAEDS